MTTPTFRDWAVIYHEAMMTYAFRATMMKRISAYILSRIERKEKALRGELEMVKGNVMLAIGVQQNDERAFDAERSRIAERVRRLGWKEAHDLADDIKEGKV